MKTSAAVNNIYLPDIVGKGYGTFWNSKKRYRVCKGSRGSKKSKTTALNLITRIIQYPLSNALCVRRYATTLRNSMYADLLWAMNKLGVRAYFDCTVSPMQMVYRPTGQKILFMGLDDGVKVTSISVEIGVLNFVWIEEAFEITEDDFNKLDLSIRGEVPDGYFKQITLIFNPWSSTSWLKKRFFDEPDDDVLAMTTTWRCNEWLDNADRQLFEKMKVKNPRRYKIESDGEWGIAEGLIFQNVEMQDFDPDELRKKEGIKAAFGLDFGYTDPNVLVCMLVDTTNETIYVFDEWYAKGITNREIAHGLKDRGYAGNVIYCDSAEPKSIAELQSEGIRAEGARKGKDSVTHGIQLMQNYKIVVHPKCQRVYTELMNYAWEKNKQGELTGRPDHEFSHGPDAMRYGVSKVLLPDRYGFE